MSHRYKPELAGGRRLCSCIFSFWTFCSLLKPVCILLSSRMVTIVETWNIDIEGLDVTSAKQVLPERIMEKMAFARFLPLRAVRKNVIKWVNFELKHINWQELFCSQCKRLNLSWGWMLFNQEVKLNSSAHRYYIKITANKLIHVLDGVVPNVVSLILLNWRTVYTVTGKSTA